MPYKKARTPRLETQPTAKEKKVSVYERLSTHAVKVKYTVIYDFHRFRTFRLESVGDFPHDRLKMGSGGAGLTDLVYIY